MTSIYITWLLLLAVTNYDTTGKSSQSILRGCKEQMSTRTNKALSCGIWVTDFEMSLVPVVTKKSLLLVSVSPRNLLFVNSCLSCFFVVGEFVFVFCFFFISVCVPQN